MSISFEQIPQKRNVSAQADDASAVDNNFCGARKPPRPVKQGGNLLKRNTLQRSTIGLLSRSLANLDNCGSPQAAENKPAAARTEPDAAGSEHRFGSGFVHVLSNGPVAQRIEHPPSKRMAAGSNPAGAATSRMGPAEWVIVISIAAYAVANLVLWIAQRVS